MDVKKPYIFEQNTKVYAIKITPHMIYSNFILSLNLKLKFDDSATEGILCLLKLKSEIDIIKYIK